MVMAQQQSTYPTDSATSGRNGPVAQLLSTVFSKSASTLGQRLQQGAGSIAESLSSNGTVRPYDPMSSAAFGMIPGAAIGGGVGLLKTILDDEDDGVMSTLGKILAGAGVGGVGGAALYGGMSAANRNKLLSSISDPTRRRQAARTLQQFELPFDKSRNIGAVNALAGADQIASPALVSLLRNKQPNERR